MTIKKQNTTPQALIKNQMTPGIHVNGANGSGDSWKAGSKITIEAGVRYSLWPQWYSRDGNLSMFDLAFYDSTNARRVDPAAGFVLPGGVDPHCHLMAGLAGAFLSVAYLSSWAEGVTAGRGWVALALVIFAGWHPIKLLGGAYLFGFAYILIAESQVLGGVFYLISTYVMQMFPYLMAIIVLAVMGRRAMKRRAGAPEALALPYVREER